jgi:hypothetical protein
LENAAQNLIKSGIRRPEKGKGGVLTHEKLTATFHLHFNISYMIEYYVIN